jgi:signal peptidase II
MKLTRLGVYAYALAAVVIVADQLSKHWVLEVFRLPERVSVPVLPVFSLTMVWNRGVSFGLLTADEALGRWLLAAFSLAVSVALILWARKVERRGIALALGLVIGGAIGNLIDRVRFGAVVDFLDFSQLGFPWVFNIADSAITVGVVLLLVDSLLAPDPKTPKPAPAPNERIGAND